MQKILQVFKKLILRAGACRCNSFSNTFGDFRKNVSSFKLVKVKSGEHTYPMSVVRCNHCGKYYLFSFHLSLDWEAVSLDEILDKYRKSRRPIEEFKRDLEVELATSRHWSVSDILEYRDGEESQG